MKEKILFIHNPGQRIYNMIKASLKKAGFDIITARNMDEVKEKISSVKPFLIILDLTVSDDSWSICRFLKGRLEISKIPLLILAEKTSASDMINARKYSVYGYMAKPYDSQLIIQMAEETLKKKRSKTILVVDNDETSLNILETNLSFAGYRVITVKDPAEALEIAKKDDFQLVITEMVLPKLDGVKFFLELRQIPSKEDIPVIILSSRDSFEDVRYAYHIGVELFITKPFDPVDLIDKVRRIFSG